jgi:hypothetical protein
MNIPELPYIANVTVWQASGKAGSWFFGTQTQTDPATVQTTIGSGSNGQSLPQATIFLGSVTGINPLGGTIGITIDDVAQVVTYSGVDPVAGTLTGCAGGTGTLVTGQAVTTYPFTYTVFNPETMRATMQIRQFADPTSQEYASLSTDPDGGLTWVSTQFFSGPPSPAQPNGIAFLLTGGDDGITVGLPVGRVFFDVFVDDGSPESPQVYVSGVFNVRGTGTR